MKDIKTMLYSLEDYVLQYKPVEWVKKTVFTTKDIYDYRYALKRIESNPTLVDYIASIILQQVKTGKRFRKVDCLKVLKSIKRNLPNYNELKSETIDKLFELYIYFIFFESDDILWSASSLLKDLNLSKKSIDWLIENFEKSEHITNRLLLYPNPNKKIKNWAKEMYLSGRIHDRNYELLAILINNDLPNYIGDEDSNTILWAIFKSRISIERKIKLTIKYSDLNSLESVIKISDRLETPKIVQGLLSKLKAS
jgi:hypothetical protein